MKKIIVLVLALFIVQAATFAADEGIQFEEGKTWKELLQMATESNRLIFMDAYTTWCGPCKKMSKEIFPQKEVGAFYNANFINVKIDMENGEGIKLAKMYNVRAYPTLLFIDGSGTLIHRVAGYMEAEDFIQLGKTANDPTKSLSALEKKYADGNRDANFLRKYTEIRYNTADGSHSEIADAYLETQDDWGTEENIEFIYQYTDDASSPAFEYLVKNKQKFKDVLGERAVTQKIEQLIYMQIYYGETQPTLEEIEGIFKKYYPEKAGELYANFKMSYYRQAGDRKGYADAAIDRFKKFPPRDYSELNEAAWTFYEVIDDKKYLKQALKWAKKSVKMSNRYENNDTVAHLYHKLGKTKKAIKYANAAIDIAKANKEDYSFTQGLLDKINEGK